jgi:hypoxanthine phosphoribosyltransferase
MSLQGLLNNLDPWSLLIGALTVVGGVVTLLSFALMIYYQGQNRLLYRERFTYSWTDILTGVQKMLRFTQTKRFTPEVVISYTGAAGVVANLFVLLMEKRVPFYQVMIADVLNSWQSVPVDYVAVETARHTIYIPNALLNVDKNTRILLIDAVSVTGTNAEAVLSCLRQHGFSKLLYISLLRVKPVNVVRCTPAFHFFENPTTEWYWPWGKGK